MAISWGHFWLQPSQTGVLTAAPFTLGFPCLAQSAPIWGLGRAWPW